MESDSATLQINFDKMKEQFDQNKKDLADTTEKLHLTDKVRHQAEISLGAAHEKDKDQMLRI